MEVPFKAVRAFRHFGWSKLGETLQNSVNEDYQQQREHVANFDRRFPIGWNAFPTCGKIVSRLWLDEEISVWAFHAIDSIRKSQYEIKMFSLPGPYIVASFVKNFKIADVCELQTSRM